MTKKDLEKQKADLNLTIEFINKQIAEIEDKENDFTQFDSFEKCCAFTGDVPDSIKFTVGAPDTCAYEKLKVITKALNNGKKVTETEYFPYFDKNKKPGSGFFDDSYRSWFVSYSLAPSRLALSTSDRALFSGEKFESIHYAYMVNND